MIAIPLMLLTAVFFVGIVQRTKSITGGRIGPGLLQHMRDIGRLLKKGSVISTTTTPVFGMAPMISLATVLMAMLFMPFGGTPAALDTGSPFEGMGANREGIYGMLVEPAFVVLMASFIVFTGHTSLTEILRDVHLGTGSVSIVMAGLAVYVILQIAMIENSRLPVDDPRTHLELTMIHEVMILDHSGFDLGVIMLTSSLKFAFFGLLLANMHLSPSAPFWAQILALGVQIIFAITVGLLESFRARNRMKRNPQFVLTLTSVAVLVYFVVLILTHKLVL
jgi:formate hydrogenlyase subunit 4